MHARAITLLVSLTLALYASASPVGQTRRSSDVEEDFYGDGPLRVRAVHFGQRRAAQNTNNTKTKKKTDTNKGKQSAQDLQKSLTLDKSVINTGSEIDGQEPPTPGQSKSQKSSNNFINYCALTLPKVPITNGKQIQGGSCNPTPMGLIPSVDKMPSAKFNFPKNGDTINANVAFNASLNVNNFQTGVFTNATTTYFSAPQTLNSKGQIIGHTHIVIEALTSLDQIKPTDPRKFIFFKGVDAVPVAETFFEALAFVNKGVPKGAYRMCSINTSANHVPVVGPIAQHGSFDDCSYFTAK